MSPVCEQNVKDNRHCMVKDWVARWSHDGTAKTLARPSTMNTILQQHYNCFHHWMKSAIHSVGKHLICVLIDLHKYTISVKTACIEWGIQMMSFMLDNVEVACIQLPMCTDTHSICMQLSVLLRYSHYNIVYTVQLQWEALEAVHI